MDEKIVWKKNQYPHIAWKGPILLTIIGIISAFSIAIYFSLKYPSPNNIYLFIGLFLSILITLPFGYFINKLVIKLSPKEVGFSKGGIHFKYIDREEYIKWDNITNYKKDNTYPIFAWKIYQKNNKKKDLAMCDQDIIDEIWKRFEKWNKQDGKNG